MLTNVVNGILEYFKHESTWKGMIVLATAAGAHIDPAQQAAIITAGLALYGLFQVFIQDRNVTK
jgi:hypothetical protein